MGLRATFVGQQILNRAEDDHILGNNNSYAILLLDLNCLKKIAPIPLPSICNDLDDVKFQRNRSVLLESDERKIFLTES
jgi:hypothetical protein